MRTLRPGRLPRLLRPSQLVNPGSELYLMSQPQVNSTGSWQAGSSGAQKLHVAGVTPEPGDLHIELTEGGLCVIDMVLYIYIHTYGYVYRSLQFYVCMYTYNLNVFYRYGGIRIWWYICHACICII